MLWDVSNGLVMHAETLDLVTATGTAISAHALQLRRGAVGQVVDGQGVAKAGSILGVDEPAEKRKVFFFYVKFFF